MATNNLPHEFISVDEACELIEADTRQNAVVDIAFLLINLPYLRVNGNYNIKLLKTINGRLVENGNKFVQIASEWDRSRLEHAITEHYKKGSGKNVDPNTIGIKSLTTTIDEDKNPQGRLVVNDKPMTKYGDPTTGGTQAIEE